MGKWTGLMQACGPGTQVVFPRAIDFGKCAVMARQVKRIQLRCKVPIAFEYELLLSESKVFEVEPRKGIVPANGGVMQQLEPGLNRLVSGGFSS